ncbi:ABC transporter permease [Stigmatella erecta]|uniref:ABC-type transport system, involved in lipoprotein release, permease component n=1 Tax=Stigmatella erecta TaxID=83460 RepID=A0A1I0CGX0_9BACT|nr:FtsX-like permease family protein [Stigmatella erecta]SET18823.1 ABC-type transport system, involved in lipoprotein release, permease component [Stigmatella erecta]
MLQILLIAFRNLLAHRRRTLLLGGAIAGVTALLIILMGVTNGMRATMLESATTLMSGHVNVGGFYKVTSGQSAAVVVNYPKLVELIRQEVPELDYVSQRGRGWAKIVSDTGSMQVGVGGIDVENEQGFRKVLQIRQGKLDDLREPGTILIFEEQAKKLEVRVGDALTLSAPTLRGTNNTLDVRVVAIAANVGMMSSFNTFVPSKSLQDLYQLKADTTGAIFLYLKDMQAIPAVQQRLREKLAAAHYTLMDNDPRAFWMKFDSVNREGWTGQKLDITNWEDEISFVQWVVKGLGFLTGFLTFVLLVIIAVGIMNTLWIAIRERTREVGTLRAIGMQRRRVLVMFLTEALMLSLSATLTGAALATAFCLGINSQRVRAPEVVQVMLLTENWFLKIEPSSVTFAVVLITVCAMVVSLIPSFLAARMKPVTAMHHIG